VRCSLPDNGDSDAGVPDIGDPDSGDADSGDRDLDGRTSSATPSPISMIGHSHRRLSARRVGVTLMP